MINTLKYYIYVHLDEDKVVYVGKGFGCRFLEHRTRKKEHRKFMETRFDLGDYSFARILGTKLPEDVCLHVEALLIQAYEPTFNRCMNIRIKSPYLWPGRGLPCSKEPAEAMFKEALKLAKPS